jgi:hypothetical protein
MLTGFIGFGAGLITTAQVLIWQRSKDDSDRQKLLLVYRIFQLAGLSILALCATTTLF